MKLRKIIRKNVMDLREWGRNPRKIDDRKFEELKKRIAAIGFNDVLKVAADGVTVIGGNHRLRAIKDLGFEEIDVMLTDASSEEEILKIALSDNQEFAEYDLAALRLQLNEHAGLDLTGYELNLGGGRPIMDVIGVTEEDDVEDDFDIEAVLSEEEKPISKPGEVYILGNHKLLCGDSTSGKDYQRLLGEEKANLVFTDPPYMVDYHSSSGRTYSSKDFGGDGSNIFNDNLDEKSAVEFYKSVLTNLYIHSSNDCPIYWWYANNRQKINAQAFEDTGWYHSQSIIWVKQQFVFSLGQDFHRMHEPCIFGWKKGKKHFKARKLNNIADTFLLGRQEFQDLPDIWLESRDKQKDYIHPTQKPVGLAIRAIRCSSIPGSIVLDVFGGSGSTLMACERMGRYARVIELDPKFCDAIRKRWARYKHGEKCNWISATPACGDNTHADQKS